MKASGPGRHPDFAIRHMTVHDELAAVLALDFQNAIVQAPVEIDLGTRQGRVECRSDAGERAVGGGDEFAFGDHGRSELRADATEPSAGTRSIFPVTIPPDGT